MGMKPLQQLLNEVTLDALIDSTNDNFSDRTIRSNESNKIHINQVIYSTGNETGNTTTVKKDDPQFVKVSNQLRDLKNQTNDLVARARKWDAAVKLNKKSSVYGALKSELSDIFKQVRNINKIYPSELVNESLINEAALDDVTDAISSNYQKLKKYAGEKKAEIKKQFDIYKAKNDLNQIKQELDTIYKKAERIVPDFKNLLSQNKTSSTTTKNILHASATANSAGKQYKVEIIFDNVKYSGENTGNLVSITDTSNNEYFISPITDNDARVTCECMDFRFRFAYANHQQKALIGTPQEYTRKPGSTRPPVNPEGRIGLCKHLIAFTKELKRNNIIK